MLDNFGRVVNYLRVSVTDRCNLRCTYCMPDEGIPWIKKKEILTYEEIFKIVSVLSELGLKKVRITGGEPLVRTDLPELVEMIASIDSINDISLSTNAILLPQYAHALKQAGIQRVNISLDSMNAETFFEITKRDDLPRVLDGIQAAEDAGFSPIKINVVVMRDMNDHEIEDFAALTLKKDYIVRFIEMMPLKENLDRQKYSYMPVDEMKSKISNLGELIPMSAVVNGGPARYFKLRSGRGQIGFISPLSHTFCEDCNRIRLTAVGELKLCLFNDPEINLRDALRAGADDVELKRLILESMKIKPLRHELETGKAGFNQYIAMSQIGG